MSTLCPECQRTLYSRRRKSCGYCGAPIPEVLRFTAEEIQELDDETERMRVRFGEFKRAAEEEEAARRAKRNDGNDVFPFMFPFF